MVSLSLWDSPRKWREGFEFEGVAWVLKYRGDVGEDSMSGGLYRGESEKPEGRWKILSSVHCWVARVGVRWCCFSQRPTGIVNNLFCFFVIYLELFSMFSSVVSKGVFLLFVNCYAYSSITCSSLHAHTSRSWEPQTLAISRSNVFCRLAVRWVVLLCLAETFQQFGWDTHLHPPTLPTTSFLSNFCTFLHFFNGAMLFD